MEKEVKQREFGIDLSRSLAILGVVLVHAGGFDFGRRGVQLFFLISGYLLALPIEKETFWFFLIRRALRLFPLYYLFLFLVFLPDYPNVLQFIFSLTLLQSLHWLAVTGPGVWSISNEWIFSLALAYFRKLERRGIYLLIGLSWVSQVATSLFVFSIGGIPENITDRTQIFYEWLNTLNPIVNASFFLIGVGLKKQFIKILDFRIAIPIMAVGIFLVEVSGHELLFLWPVILWATFSFCLKIQSRGKLFSTVVAFIGMRTYGIFFIHFLFVGMIMKYFRELLGTHNQIIVSLLTFTTALMISLPLSELTWRVLEKPFIKFSRAMPL